MVTLRQATSYGGYGAWRFGQVVHGSNPTENQKYDHDEEGQPYPTGRGITPFPAMRPPGQRAKKR
jgi:hypothetical protein